MDNQLTGAKQSWKSLIGSQPFERGVAYQIGQLIPIGKEVEAIFELQSFWPNLPSEEAYGDFLNGLESRFNTQSAIRDRQ